MTYGTLEHRYVSEIYRMLELLVRAVARIASPVSECPQIYGMGVWPALDVLFGRSGRVVNDRVADIAVIRYHFTCLANMLAVMTSETSLRIQMAGIVRMGLPIRLHFREEVVLEYPLDLSDGALDQVRILGMKVSVIGPVKFVNVRIYSVQCLFVRLVLTCQNSDSLPLQKWH